mmetsp:Transcript_98258/g.174943  ORF Transcript_98258/g.174943 Transcript_98258/m.174943 type:complete len:204 (+) Transcript_98258:35-646(+)|eukprot:CAMPEP_0197650892 /NCGR_PEP_ID=MMETSP1338-20131121/31225_1 /TAXON_ID=43686 ORGANISM="Pelagodinium beii, Strain RCC1491" /NCGR_SAMPLE_ID=MMETSP1338 /ASSEMBLY_ACC=CAM_ASM_000754 /LENGTH=203 /DNA_ID=CAMNT_0043225401 /DNA_START=35 /DNA_END=646 /DNA_ORIENTATION=-
MACQLLAGSRSSMSRRTRSHLGTAVLTLCAVGWIITDIRPSWLWVQGRLPATSGRILHLRAAQDDDTGEFDFGEYDAPVGVSVLEADEEAEPVLAPPEAEMFMQRETGKYECGNCGYVYDPFYGAGKIEQGTKFQDLPVAWRCPDCRVSKDDFSPVMEEIAGFAENQGFGLGFNSMTSGEKGVWIGASLALAISFFVGSYAFE